MGFYMDLHLVSRELVVTGVDGDAKSKLLWKQEIHIMLRYRLKIRIIMNNRLEM